MQISQKPPLNQKRKYCITASELYNILQKTFPTQTAETYLYKKVAYILGAEWKQELNVPSVNFGKEFEPIAFELLKYEYNDLEYQDFAYCEEYNFGGTPDAYSRELNAIFEIKCPYSIEKHVENLMIKGNADLLAKRSEYYAQMQAYMYLKKADFGYFVSFDPRQREKRFSIHSVKIHKDEKFIAFMLDRIKQANEFIDKTLERIIQS